ncbi:hypothetical protein OS31_07670 [Dickeya oryzae]
MRWQRHVNIINDDCNFKKLSPLTINAKRDTSMSTPVFRRTALCAALLVMPAFGVLAADIAQVKITVNDKQCEPMQVTVAAGKTQFVVTNASQKKPGVGNPQRGDGGGRA